MGFFDKLKKITTNLFTTYTEADEAFFEELEETLILSDFGMEVAVETVEKLREKVRKEKLKSQEEVRTALREMEEALDAALPRKLVLDLSGVTFMDSSGIAVILRARQKMQLLDGGLLVRGVPPQARRVLEAAGVNRLVTIK